MVDPLDGTREFTGGGNDFAVNIGLVRDWTAGSGRGRRAGDGGDFGGIVGVGAWRQKDGMRTAISARGLPPEG